MAARHPKTAGEAGAGPRRKSLLGLDVDDDLQAAIQASLRDSPQRHAGRNDLRTSLLQTKVSLEDQYHSDLDEALTRSVSGERRRPSVLLREREDEELARAIEESYRSQGQVLAESKGGNSGRRSEGRRSSMEDLARALEESAREAGVSDVSNDRDDLVRAIYEREGIKPEDVRKRTEWFLKSLSLAVVEAGSLNTCESEKMMTNQCFYLALARSFLGPSETPQGRALIFKRIIEETVLKAHPEWTDSGKIGENVQVFSDFLTFPMKDKACEFSKMAVVVVDSVSGMIEIYKGINYDSRSNASKLAQNLLLLWYVPGHYQALAADDPKRSKPKLALSDVRAFLDKENLSYVETCG